MFQFLFFFFLVGISVAIASFVATIKVCAITARIKKYKPITDKKNSKIVLLAKTKLNTVEV